MEAIREAGITNRCGPARRRVAAVLAGHRLTLQAEHHHRELDDRSGVRVHDAGPRRQDPDGLFQPIRDGGARRAEGSVPGSGRERSRCRPARHRDAFVRADEPEPFSGGRDRLSARQPAPWPAAAAIGKTVVSSSMIDRVTRDLGRRLAEVPVGFKWFAPGLADGRMCFGGEESAGASFLRRNGTVWTTDKDGMIMGLLAAEISARTGKDPGSHYRDWRRGSGRRTTRASTRPRRRAEGAAEEALARGRQGDPACRRAHRRQADPRAGERRADQRSEGRGQSGWFAARPSGTEDLYKIYAESFRSQSHLEEILTEAQQIVDHALAG